MSVITEKKPLLIQIPGERTPNELPVSASAVGYDFVQGNYIYYATGSDSWETAPPNGGGGGGGGAGQDIYSGYTTSSLNWSATTWTDFHTVATHFTSSIAPGNITLSGSTFTVTNAGVYYWISNFNCFGNNGWYVGWRISGSNGTLLQQTNYSVIDQGPGVVAGLINLSAGESFKFQYAGKYGGGNPGAWVPTNPIGNTDPLNPGYPDYENMRTGNITIYKIA